MLNVSYRFARNHKLRKDGTGAIQLRIYDPRTIKITFLKTGQYCKPEHWDQNANMVKEKADQGQYLYLTKILTKLKDFIRDAGSNGKIVNVEETLHTFRVLRDGKKSGEFVPFFEAQLNHRLKMNEISKGTHKKAKSTLKLMQDWYPDLQISDIDKNWMKSFEDRLKKFKFRGKKYEPATIDKHMVIVRTYFNLARVHGLVNGDPLYGMKRPRVESMPKYLTEEELLRIEKLEFDPEYAFLEIHRDFFLFSTYAGMRFEDAQSITRDMITQEGDEFYIAKVLEKTSRIRRIPHKIPVTRFYGDKMRRLIEKYFSESHQPFKTTNQSENKQIKQVCALAGIHKRVTTHYARHTCGMLLMNYTRSVDVVRAYLGHANNTMALRYAQMTTIGLERGLDMAGDKKWGSITKLE